MQTCNPAFALDVEKWVERVKEGRMAAVDLRIKLHRNKNVWAEAGPLSVTINNLHVMRMFFSISRPVIVCLTTPVVLQNNTGNVRIT